ncbi:MAG: hypothetical protein A3J75_02750 [Acidobacteria bacterium RBG_16_68_9]|nr:MAG: hypothetical protein A3J75_02750 [Acidobacteria bacterium RBG_16_68_9]
MATVPIITLLTDFGTADAYVGIMKGVILGICPAARLVDLTHDLPPQGIIPGALVLRNAVPFFPAGTTHLAVVDPGVGSGRDPIAIVTERGVLVGPDNGLLHPAALAMGVREVRRLERTDLFRQPVSHTFHGRDVFAPVAAHLATGLPPHELGSLLPAPRALPLAEPRCGSGRVSGEVIYVDRFGNLITNIAAGAMAGFSTRNVSVSIAGVPVVPIVTAYAAVPEGSLLAIIGSWGLIEVAVRSGNAAQRLAATTGTVVTVTAE